MWDKAQGMGQFSTQPVGVVTPISKEALQTNIEFGVNKIRDILNLTDPIQTDPTPSILTEGNPQYLLEQAVINEPTSDPAAVSPTIPSPVPTVNPFSHPMMKYRMLR